MESTPALAYPWSYGALWHTANLILPFVDDFSISLFCCDLDLVCLEYVFLQPTCLKLNKALHMSQLCLSQLKP